MGASAIRLVIAEIRGGRADPDRRGSVARRAARPRHVLSAGAIRSEDGRRDVSARSTGSATSSTVYGVQQIRAVATSAVREARNGDLFLDRVRGRTGIDVRRSSTRRRRAAWSSSRCAQRCADHAAFRGALDAAGRGRRRQHQPDAAAARRTEPFRASMRWAPSGSASSSTCGATATKCRSPLLKRDIANVIEEIRRRDAAAIASPTWWPSAATCASPRRRCRSTSTDGGVREIAAGRVSGVLRRGRAARRGRARRSLPAAGRRGRDAGAGAARLPRAAVAETAARTARHLGRLAAGRHAARFRRARATARAPRTSSARCWPAPKRSGSGTGSIAPTAITSRCSRRGCSTSCSDEHGLSDRDRLLLQVAALLHDVGIYVSLRAHHKHSQYLLAASQIFGLSDEETAIVANIARYHRGAPPAEDPPAVPGAGPGRPPARQQAGGDPARGQRARRRASAEGARLRIVRGDTALDAASSTARGDLTMEQLAATARADMFVDSVRPAARDPRRGATGDHGRRTDSRDCSSTASCRGSRSTSACSKRPPTPTTPLLERVKFAAIAAVEPRRVLHGPRRRH